MAPFSGSRAATGILPDVNGDGGSGTAALEAKFSGAAAALEEDLEWEDGGPVAAPSFGNKAAAGSLPGADGDGESGAAAL